MTDPHEHETLADTLAACTGDDTAEAVEAALRYVCGRVAFWTREAMNDGITAVLVEHQSSRVQQAADELRRYLELRKQAS